MWINLENLGICTLCGHTSGHLKSQKGTQLLFYMAIALQKAHQSMWGG